MTTIKKKFGKYNVELDIKPKTENDDAYYDCFISYVTRSKREYTASLACAQATGELESSYGTVHVVESAILDDIEQWAIENGY